MPKNKVMSSEEKEAMDTIPQVNPQSPNDSNPLSPLVIPATSTPPTPTAEDPITLSPSPSPFPVESPSSPPANPLISIDQSTQSRIRASLHRLFTRQSTNSTAPISSSMSTSSSSSKKKVSVPNNRRMMTSEQLSDLFRRLDKDGNGELDLEEFSQIITKLQMNVSEEFVTKIFQKVNTSQTGSIKLQEFVSAYQLLFTRPSIIATSGNSKSHMTLKKPNEVICALRYGTDSSGKYLYEMYLGTVIDLSDGPILTMHEKRVYQLTPDDLPEDMAYDVIENWSSTLNELNEMITQDSLNNKTKKTKIYWWIDVSMIKVAAHRVDKYIAGLGLPNDSKFRSAFSQFGTCLTKDEKSHIYLGNGMSTLGGVSSLNLFVQAIWVTRLPISHHIPYWLDYAFETFCPVSLKNSIKDYYFKRFAFLFSSPNPSTSNEEYRNAYENSQLLAHRLEEEHDEDGPPSPTISNKLSFNLLAHSPLPARSVSKFKSAPTWLLSIPDLRNYSPRLKFEDLSIHLISQGHEPACLLTIREIDPELVNKSQKKTSILEDSKTGVLGRIITGLRIKMMKNLTSDGIVSVAGEITDCPAALASILFSLTQAYSMNTLGSLAEWMKLISAGVDDLAVSKHSEHAKYLSDMTISLYDYVEPTYRFLHQLYSDGADILREEAIQAEEALELDDGAKPKFERLESIHSSDDSDSNSGDEKDPWESSSSRSKQTKQKKSPQTQSKRGVRAFKVVAPRRRTGMATEVQLSTAPLPPGVNNLPVSFAHCRLFLGTNALHYLSIMLDGDESLEVKGVKYWMEQLANLQQAALKIKDDIHSSLEEKRNFFSFILTIVTVGLAPMTILTGYWGMNFQNMAELNPHTYPAIPGVTIIWVTGFFTYFTFLIMSVHFRILYSAT